MSISKKGMKAALCAFLSIVLALALTPALSFAAVTPQPGVPLEGPGAAGDEQPKAQFIPNGGEVAVGDAIRVKGLPEKYGQEGLEMYFMYGSAEVCPVVEGQTLDPVKTIQVPSISGDFVNLLVEQNFTKDFKLKISATYFNGFQWDVIADEASYSLKTIPVKFDAHGGEGTMADDVAFLGGFYQVPECGFISTDPNNPEFKNWNTNADGSGTTYYPGQSATIPAKFQGEYFNLSAMWGAKTSNVVSFDANGGSGTMYPVKVPVATTEYTLPECGFTAPEGKQFKGWTVNSEEEVLQPGAVIPIDANIYLHAQWEDAPAPIEKLPVYRLYNPFSGAHLYTLDANERGTLISLGWKPEGIGWVAPSYSDVPAYRMYNKFTGEHLYTLDENERDTLASIGWTYENIAFYSAAEDQVPVYRLFNPFAQENTHLYTTDIVEKNSLVYKGWKDEGTGWFGLK